MHTAQLRVELSQSLREQREYLKNVELARVLDKRAERKRKTNSDLDAAPVPSAPRPILEEEVKPEQPQHSKPRKRQRRALVEDDGANTTRNKQLDSVLNSIF